MTNSDTENTDGYCAQKWCRATPRWLVEIIGHPNGDPAPTRYCTRHAHERAILTWDDSPTPYTIKLSGPYHWNNPDEFVTTTYRPA